MNRGNRSGIPVKQFQQNNGKNNDDAKSMTNDSDFQKQKESNGKIKPLVGDKLKTLLEQKQHHEKTILILEKENNTLNTKIQRLELMCSKQVEEKEDYDNLCRELSRKTETYDNLQKQFFILQGELNDYKERATIAENSLAEKDLKLEDFQNSTESRRFELQHLIQENENLTNKIQEKDNLVAQYLDEIEKYKDNSQKLELDNQDLRSQIFLSEAENDSIVKKLNDKTKESDALRNDLNSITEKLRSTEEELAKAQEIIKLQKKEGDDMNMHLQSNYADQMNENIKLNGTLRDKEITITEQKRQINLMAKNITKLEENISKLQEEKETLTQQFDELQQTHQDCKSTVKSQERKIESLNQIIIDKDNEKQNLQTHYDKVQRAMENQQNNELFATIENQHSEISKQNREIENLKSKLADSSSQNIGLQDKVKALNQNNNSLQDKYDECTNQINKLKSSYHQLKDEFSLRQNENDKLNAEINSLNQEVKIGNAQIAALTTENLKLQNQINQLSETADKICGANDKPREKSEEQLKSRLDALEKLNNILHDENTREISEKNKIQQELIKMNKKMKDLQNQKTSEESGFKIQYVQRVIELEEELKTYRQSPAFVITENKIKNYENQINKLNTKIQAMQAEYDKRDMKKTSHHPSGEKFMIQSQKSKIQEQERIIEQLKFENQALSNAQVLENNWKVKFEELVKKDLESREELKKSVLQIRYRLATAGLESENPQNQM